MSVDDRKVDRGDETKCISTKREREEIRLGSDTVWNDKELSSAQTKIEENSKRGNFFFSLFGEIHIFTSVNIFVIRPARIFLEIHASFCSVLIFFMIFLGSFL